MEVTDGRVRYRGIELGRHDYPTLLKRFQQSLLDVILEADSAQDIVRKQLKSAMEYSKERESQPM